MVLFLPLTCQITGYPGRRVDPIALFGSIALEFNHGARAAAHQAHLAAEDVQYLRQLIQTCGPKEASARNEARIQGVQFRHGSVIHDQFFQILFMCSRLGIHPHGPKFEDHELFAPVTNPALPVKRRTGRRQLNQAHQEQHQRQPNPHRASQITRSRIRFHRGRRGLSGISFESSGPGSVVGALSPPSAAEPSTWFQKDKAGTRSAGNKSGFRVSPRSEQKSS